MYLEGIGTIEQKFIKQTQKVIFYEITLKKDFQGQGEIIRNYVLMVWVKAKICVVPDLKFYRIVSPQGLEESFKNE